MTTLPYPHSSRSSTYQQRFARSLINCLGFDGAMDACRRNCWDGVLDVLIRMDQRRPC